MGMETFWCIRLQQITGNVFRVQSLVQIIRLISYVTLNKLDSNN